MIEPTPPSYRPILKDFKAASERIKGIATRTPLLSLRWYDDNPEILLKPEVLQPIGSYKIRGIYNLVAQISPEQRSQGISTLSSGNMAQAVAYVGKLFGISAKVYIREDAQLTKINSVKRYGAEVILISPEKRINILDNPPEDSYFIHPISEFSLMDGYGTIGLEIIEDAPETETIYVPLGVGFLGSAVALAAKALKPSVRVIGVNAENSPHYYECFKQGKIVATEIKTTLADGTMGNLADFPNYAHYTLRLIQEAIDDVVIVSEEKIEDAIRYLALENKLIVEGSGALSLAAALDTPKEERAKTVCVLSGGSIDADKLSKIISKQNR
jgi:threonine dehydratase